MKIVWENKIVGHGERPASEFLANPNNWKIHPASQQSATRGSLSDVGWIKSVIVNKRTSPEWGEEQILGSGTTIVACEKNNRRGYGIEQNPAYVAVALERLSEIGLTATLVN